MLRFLALIRGLWTPRLRSLNRKVFITKHSYEIIRGKKIRFLFIGFTDSRKGTTWRRKKYILKPPRAQETCPTLKLNIFQNLNGYHASMKITFWIEYSPQQEIAIFGRENTRLHYSVFILIILCKTVVTQINLLRTHFAYIKIISPRYIPKFSSPFQYKLCILSDFSNKPTIL